MKGTEITPRRLALAAGVFFICLLALASASRAGDLRARFVKDYRAKNLPALSELVKTNAPAISAEVKAILKEAMADGVDFEQRMRLLDIASAMASMHKHWNGDELLAAEVDAILRAEVDKEKKRRAELTRRENFKKFLGNFVLRDKAARMEATGLAPVLYPHWLHRLYYSCKACHGGLFKMKRGADTLTHAAMRKGRVCGRCHDGKTAFSTETPVCKTCHAAGLDEARRFADVSTLDLDRVKKTAERVGSVWSTEDLPPGRIPLDRFGSIDWVYLRSVQAIKPVKSLDGEAREKVRDNVILFESPMEGISTVPFDHKTHSSRIRCASCHPALFKKVLGGNKVDSKAMARGKFCGYCHGKVAFRFAECNKCHTTGEYKPPEGALRRGE
ncbi:MAG: c(7)-type cytochrome triheme domain-containing protein [Thermodesulfobacteriota bacterium]